MRLLTGTIKFDNGVPCIEYSDKLEDATITSNAFIESSYIKYSPMDITKLSTTASIPANVSDEEAKQAIKELMLVRIQEHLDIAVPVYQVVLNTLK